MRRVSALVLIVACGAAGLAQAPAREPPAPAASGSVRGRVVAEATGEPLANARVVATSDSDARNIVFTDADGRYVFTPLAAARYRIAAAKSGYLTTAFGGARFQDPGTPIPVTDRRSVEEVDIGLARAAAISGRILDERGDPLIGMTVTAELIASDAKAHEGVVVARSQLDDLGDYRLRGLPEGSFLVSVEVAQPVLGPNGTLQTGRELQGMVRIGGGVVPPAALALEKRVYYPGIGAAGSQPIALAAGEERTSLDFAVAAAPMRTWASVVGAPPVRPPEPGGVIRGRVTGADGRPLPSVAVRLLPERYPGVPPSTITDADGRYELRVASGATFRIIAERSGYLSYEHGQRRPFESGDILTVREGEARERIDITLPAPGAITGRVVDERGDPVEGASIRMLRTGYEAGGRRLADAPGLGNHRTDDLGRYRVYGLRPGHFIVSAAVGQVGAGGAIMDLPGYAPTYFPGTPNAGDAQWIQVDLSAQKTGIDFTLSPVTTARVAGTRLDEAGNPAGGSLILSPSRRSGSVAPLPVGARTYPDGRFEFPNVPPGEYVVQASTPRGGPATEGEFASMFVTVEGQDVNGLVLRTSSGSTLRGRVTVDGSPDSWLWSELTISTLPVDLDRSPLIGNPAAAGVRDDWTFEMSGLSGPRLLRISNAPPGFALKEVRVNGIDVTDTPLPFGAAGQSIADVEVVLTDRVSELSGAVTDARGRALAGRDVVVFAADRERWGPASRFVTAARSGRDGVFGVRKLPPGEYLVAAIDGMIDGEWQDRDLLESLAPHAARVTLDEGQRAVVSAPLVAR